MDDAKIPRPFRIEPLCQLPCSLARTELVARPCVAFLHSDDGNNNNNTNGAPTVEEGMMPRLDAKEVAAVFSAPFRNFLRAEDEPAAHPDNKNNAGDDKQDQSGTAPPPPPGNWYDGYWVHFHETPWRVHNFHVPVNTQRVVRPRPRRRSRALDQPDEDDNTNKNSVLSKAGAQSPQPEQEQDQVQRFLVWGFTGRILVDAARIAYAEEPAFEHNAHYGDEALIARLEAEGALPEKERRGRPDVGVDATKEVVNDTKI